MRPVKDTLGDFHPSRVPYCLEENMLLELLGEMDLIIEPALYGGELRNEWGGYD